METYDGTQLFASSGDFVGADGFGTMTVGKRTLANPTTAKPPTGAVFLFDHLTESPTHCANDPVIVGGVADPSKPCTAGARDGQGCVTTDIVCNAAAGFCRRLGAMTCIKGQWVGDLRCEPCVCGAPTLPATWGGSLSGRHCDGTAFGALCPLVCTRSYCGQPVAQQLIKCSAAGTSPYDEDGSWVLPNGAALSTAGDSVACAPCAAASCNRSAITPEPSEKIPAGYDEESSSVTSTCGAMGTICTGTRTHTCGAGGTYTSTGTCLTCSSCASTPVSDANAAPTSYGSAFDALPAAGAGVAVTPTCGSGMCGTPSGAFLCDGSLGTFTTLQKASGCFQCSGCSVHEARQMFPSHVIPSSDEWQPHTMELTLTVCDPLCTMTGAVSGKITCADGQWTPGPPLAGCTCV